MAGWPWLRTSDATRQINAMTAEFERVDRELLAKERQCPRCLDTAYFEDEGPEGLRSYVCPNGHRLLVAPEGRA